ncbi:dolichol-phosphate mannosyltransferase subunit 3 [Colletotrichum graminicola]|nr:dolichol-phosphate mannosyltransferase subunit 3 [Colletotrichum graminicola]
MTRAQQTISLALLVSSLYLALYLQLIPIPAVIQTEIVPVVRPSSSVQKASPTILAATSTDPCVPLQLPFWALISFGSYLLARLGYNVMTFNDVPEAHKELMAEIDEAVVDLRKLGVDVD